MVYFPGGGADNWSWRIPTLIQGFGPVILAIGVWFIPQSPRWLVKQGRADEAHRILATYHANGDLDDPLVQLEMREIQAAVNMEEISNTGTWKSFLSTVGNRRRFFVIIMIGTATQWHQRRNRDFQLVRSHGWSISIGSVWTTVAVLDVAGRSVGLIRLYNRTFRRICDNSKFESRNRHDPLPLHLQRVLRACVYPHSDALLPRDLPLFATS